MGTPLPEMDPPMDERDQHPGEVTTPPPGPSRTTLAGSAGVSGTSAPEADAPAGGSSSGGDGIRDTAVNEAGRTGAAAANEAKELATTAGEGVKQVAQTAGQQAREVAQEAARQARNLTDEARQQLRRQAEQETGRAASNLHALSDQARALSEGRVDDAGPLVEQVRRLADQLAEVAGRLERRGFDGVLHDVQSFARRRPAAFIGLTAIAGFAVTRIARSVGSSSNDASQTLPPGGQAGMPGALPPGGMPLASDPSLATPVEGSAGSEPTGVILIEEETVVLEDITPDPYEPASQRVDDGGS